MSRRLSGRIGWLAVVWWGATGGVVLAGGETPRCHCHAPRGVSVNHEVLKGEGILCEAYATVNDGKPQALAPSADLGYSGARRGVTVLFELYASDVDLHVCETGDRHPVYAWLERGSTQLEVTVEREGDARAFPSVVLEVEAWGYPRLSARGRWEPPKGADGEALPGVYRFRVRGVVQDKSTYVEGGKTHAVEHPNSLDGPLDLSSLSFHARLTLLKVNIEKCASGFLPQGGTNDNTTTIRAFLTPDTVKGKIKFTLFDVSDEKGYCLNAPTNPPASGEDSDAWKDYQFATQTGFTISGSDNNIAETVTNNLHEATVTIKSFDYGSFGKIKAEFTTQDGSLTCIAKEVGGTNEYTRLPADTNANNIADSWSGDTGPGGSSLAADDTDNVPTGKIGDGFTRYEEWRGFVVGGIHIRTDPTKRDLFVYDPDGIGIGYYTSGSGIQVHLINAGEWSGAGKKADDKRIININRETAVSSKQYGLHVYDGGTPGGTEGGYCYGDPDDSVPLGPPNACRKIKVNTGNIHNWFPTNAQQVIDRTLAHEMGHGTGVPHHTPSTGGQLCPMREPCSDTNIGTTFCTTNDNCQSKIDVKDP